MPERKVKSQKSKGKSTSRKPTVVRKPRVTSSNGPTYDTLMIITILLLLFVYPSGIGIICMWLWMKTWPVWLKIVISLPFLIAVVFIVIIFSVFKHAMQNRTYNRMIYEKQTQMIYTTPTQQSY